MIIRAMELGYGTSTVITGENAEGGLMYRTFPSVPVHIHDDSIDLGAEILATRKRVLVEVKGQKYEVGEDVMASSDPRSARNLNDDYINSDRYQALLKASIMMIPENDIDLFVCGLPVDMMTRRDELKNMIEGTQTINNRVITIKKVLVFPQPLGGLLTFARSLGKEIVKSLMNENVLVCDPGYLTFDWLVTRGLKPNENRSGTCKAGMGMSKVLDSVVKAASKIEELGVKKPNIEVFDDAFVLGKLRIFGREYDFPVNTSKAPHFDFTPDIDRVVDEAVSEMKNSIGDAQDISKIIVVGGPADIYARSIAKAYPYHEIQVVNDPVRANAFGYYYGGKHWAQALEKRNHNFRNNQQKNYSVNV